MELKYKLHQYILDQSLTIPEAAEQLGITRQHMHALCCKGQRAGKVLAKTIEQWSDGQVSRLQVLYPNTDGLIK
jgi:hypothetical protein